ncbi:MAG: DUF4261 domain-containing protein [Deltaproteobacteria bacterium]|nr:DUF4261 domain-containing protein [Deltaproteobacteria bacterium]
MAELLCEEPVVLAKATRDGIVADIREALGGVQVLRNDGEALHLALEGCPVEYEDGEVVPAQILFLSDASPHRNPDPQKAAATLETSLGQTWGWDAARDVVANAPHTLLVTDFLSTGLDPRRRIAIFSKVLYAAAKHIPCAALHFPSSQCLLRPEDFLAAAPDDPDHYPLLGLVNVRLYAVEGSEDEIVMDTLGLHVFGLPDVQCHCSGADPDELGNWLYTLADVIAETDRDFEDGVSVEAFDGSRMRLRYAEPLVEPGRFVLDLQPAYQEE